MGDEEYEGAVGVCNGRPCSPKLSTGADIEVGERRLLPADGACLLRQAREDVAVDRPEMRVGDWLVIPSGPSLCRNGEIIKVDPRAMRILLRLVDQAGETVNNDTLLNCGWPSTTVSPDSLYQTIASLRRLLGDDPKDPRYIASLPREGYRLIAPVQIDVGRHPAIPITQSRGWTVPHLLVKFPLAAGAILAGIFAFAVVAYLSIRSENSPEAVATAAPAQKKHGVAVLPFADLTSQQMQEGFLADGLTEELIDKLSHVSSLRVSPPNASFAFKDKAIPLEQIMHMLQVDYLLDGSIRKSGPTLRVSARLVRSDGFVAWSETYDRESGDVLVIEDDIAKQVVSAIGSLVRPTAPATTKAA